MVDHSSPEQVAALEAKAEVAIAELLDGLEALQEIREARDAEQWEVFCTDTLQLQAEHVDDLIELGREMRGEAIRGRIAK